VSSCFEHPSKHSAGAEPLSRGIEGRETDEEERLLYRTHHPADLDAEPHSYDHQGNPSACWVALISPSSTTSGLGNWLHWGFKGRITPLWGKVVFYFSVHCALPFLLIILFMFLEVLTFLVS
jgi:hypothetical protein